MNMRQFIQGNTQEIGAFREGWERNDENALEGSVRRRTCANSYQELHKKFVFVRGGGAEMPKTPWEGDPPETMMRQFIWEKELVSFPREPNC